MFRHRHKRTHAQDLRIATLLSFVAGSVNVIGFIAVHRLTTNITGHFAFFMDDVLKLHWVEGIIYFGFVLAFLLGAFVANTLVEVVHRFNERNIFIAPVALEITILLAVAVSGRSMMAIMPDVLALVLLFAMGMQNSLVTRISNAVVRTTHLTGLFTDLGIELSQLFFYRTQEQRGKLYANIQLRLGIIVFFFLGGVTAGLLYTLIAMHALLVPALLLAIGLIYDRLKYSLRAWTKKDQRPSG